MLSTSAAEQSSAMKESPNWLEMPDEVMANIFQRLHMADILNTAPNVCTSWQRICKDPAMWEVIDRQKLFDPPNTCYTNFGREILTKQAVDLSRGELINISIKGFGTDDLLDYIVLRSSKLKCLSLVGCSSISSRGLSRAVKRVPQLEELDISFSTSIDAKDIKVIGQNCPQLKSFKMGDVSTGKSIICDDHALAIANNMPELHHLVLIENEMTNDGLEAILNGCPHLQSLDVGRSYKLDLDGNLGNLCMERIKDFKHKAIQKCGFAFQDYDYLDVGDYYDDDYNGEDYLDLYGFYTD